MATKGSAGTRSTAGKTATKRRATKRAPAASERAEPSRAAAPQAASAAGDPFGAMPRMAKMLTPEQAIEMYKANARMALDVINAAIEGAERVRRKQFEGEEAAARVPEEACAARRRR